MTTVDVACECTECRCVQMVAVSYEATRGNEPVLCLFCEVHDDEGGEG